jgi:hypothetical protein
MIKRTQFFSPSSIYNYWTSAVFSKRIGINNILLLILWYSLFLDKYSLSLTNIIQNALRQITDNFYLTKTCSWLAMYSWQYSCVMMVMSTYNWFLVETPCAKLDTHAGTWLQGGAWHSCPKENGPRGSEIYNKINILKTSDFSH